MGSLFSYLSKPDVAAIASAEANVVSLIMRIGEEEAKIDQYVKQRISKALRVYSSSIDEGSKKGYFSKQKASKMKELIKQANKKLDGVTSKKISEKPRTNTTYSTHKMRTYLSDIIKQMEKEKIRKEECEQVLDTVSQYSQILEFRSELSPSQAEDDNLSMLFLKLFLKSPATKVTDILEKVNHTLDDIRAYFEVLDVKNMTAFNNEEIMNQLEQTQRKIQEMNEVTTKEIESLQQVQMNIEEKMGTSRPKREEVFKSENILKQLETDLNECEKIMETLSPPISDSVVAALNKKVSNLLEFQLTKITREGGETFGRKEALRNKAQEILKRLSKMDGENKEVEGNLETLNRVQDEMCSLLEYNIYFQERIKGLETFAEVVSQIKTHNNEVKIPKNEISNRIEGLLVAESLSYLRQLKKKIDYHKRHAQQFSYPKKIYLYELKIKEIDALKNKLDAVPKGRKCIEERVKIINEQIDQTVEILNRKAANNERILSTVDYLEHIARQIDSKSHSSVSPLEKLVDFNQSRERIHNADNCHPRLCSKKSQIIHQLQSFEKNIYLSVFPKEIQILKGLLDECENDVQQFASASANEFYKKRENISNLWKQAEALCHANDLSNEKMHVFYHNCRLVLKLLENHFKDAKANFDRTESLKAIEIEINSLSKHSSVTRKLETLDGYLEIVQAKKRGVTSTKVLHKLETTENIIFTEKLKIKLPDLSSSIQELVKDVADLSCPIDALTFNEAINTLFSLKESVDDVPEGDPELDSAKQAFLKCSFKALEQLDGHVANFVANRVQTESILNLQDYFKGFNSDEFTMKRDSIEFIRKISLRAQEFEACVKGYLGSKTSMDYYVVHENLMRLLEQLDKLNGADQVLLGAMIEAITYIKGLIDELESNACN